MYNLPGITIIPFGAPGAGKSLMANLLVCGKVAGPFQSSQSTQSGLTRIITSAEGHAFNNASYRRVKVFDIPGIGDTNLELTKITDEIRVKCGTQKFDACIIVVKATDYRVTLQEVLALKCMREFLVGFSAQRVFCVITHCDKFKPDEEQMKSKIESFKKYGGVECPMDHIIQFNGTWKSLVPLITKIQGDQMTFASDIRHRALNLSKDIPALVSDKAAEKKKIQE